MSEQAMHVNDERLQRYADGELDGGGMETVRRHVAGCAQCRLRLDEMARAADAYLEYHRHALITRDPAPPRPWEDLRPAFERLNRSSSRAHPRSALRWLAVAAALVVAVALGYRLNRVAPVNAAELLRKAASVEAPPNPARRIRVRSAGRSLVRPAVLSARREPVAPALEPLFLAAHFSWQDPLSARSFGAWRDQLSQKDDRVRVTSGRYEIHTATRSGPLRTAILVLDAGDLHPMSETLQFVDDRVEISEAEPEPAARAPSAPSAPLVAPLPTAAPAAGAGRELRVLAALHAIGADLGEPVEVTRRGASVIVATTGLTSAREQQVRDAVAPIPGVTVRADAPEAAPMSSPAGAPTATAAGVRTQLEAVLGEPGVNRILDASEAVMARVHALRGLSRRFPPAVEAQLADADRNVLASLRSEHVSGISAHLRALQSALAPLLPKLPPAPSPAAAPWQTHAARIFTAAQTVDHLLNRILAGGEDYAQRAPELAEALRRLDAEVAAEVRP